MQALLKQIKQIFRIFFKKLNFPLFLGAFW